jgi:Protein of unknown function (DUF559)
VPLPGDLHGRPFSLTEANQRGVRPGRLRGADLHVPYPGVRHTKPLAVIPEPWKVYAVRMPAGQFFSHITAARIHGLPLPLRLAVETRIDVAAEIPHQCPRMDGVRGHRVKAASVAVVLKHGLRVSSPVETWRQLSTVLSLDDLIAVGDALVRRKEPMATMSELRSGIIRHGGHRGARKLRAAFESVRAGVDSPRETALRLIILRAGLPEPEFNGVIWDVNGRQIATGDLVFRKYKVLVEYDGEQHRLDEEQYNWDIDRLDRIREAGWLVVRINKTHLRGSTLRTERKIEKALRASGWRP